VKPVIFVLADAASVREGLLHLLGAGINIIRRGSYPAPLGSSLALLLELSPDGEPSHELEIKVMDEQGTPVAQVEVESLRFGPPEDTEIPALASIVVPLGPTILPAPGRYRITLAIDEAEVGALEFKAVLVDEGETQTGDGHPV
jgi:hypothetical protein